MDRPTDAVLDAFREALHPAAFVHRFTGTSVRVVGAPRASTPTGFAGWVDAHLARLRHERWPRGGRPTLVVLVEDGEAVLRRWDEAPCCEAARLAARVRPEAAPLTAPWVLGVDVAPPGSSEVADGGTGAPADPAAGCTSDVGGTLAWYAESRRPGVARVRAGVQVLARDPRSGVERVLRAETSGPRRDAAARAFRRVLAGHPARAAHPLR